MLFDLVRFCSILFGFVRRWSDQFGRCSLFERLFDPFEVVRPVYVDERLQFWIVNAELVSFQQAMLDQRQAVRGGVRCRR